MAGAAPGWYPDPHGGPGKHYWDGVKWTDLPLPPPRGANALPSGASVVVRGPNHQLHLVLTVLTCGLWAIPWFFIAIANRPRETIEHEFTPLTARAVALRLLLLIVVVGVVIAVLVNLA